MSQSSVLDGLSGVSQVAAGHKYTCVLISGAIYCWGASACLHVCVHCLLVGLGQTQDTVSARGFWLPCMVCT